MFDRLKRQFGAAKAAGVSEDEPAPLLCTDAEPHGFYQPPYADSCPDDCLECSQQYRTVQDQRHNHLRYADAQGRPQIRNLATDYTNDIFNCIREIKQLTSSHGSTISNRWRKKTVDKRKDLVRAAAPHMYEKKLPQAQLFYDYPFSQVKGKFRLTRLLPYITVENLCDDKLKFLRVLNARSQYHPEAWVIFNFDQIRAAYGSGYINLDFHPDCVVMHGKDYGSLTEWNQADAHAWNIIGWPLARLILEAQARLLQLFVRIT